MRAGGMLLDGSPKKWKKKRVFREVTKVPSVAAYVDFEEIGFLDAKVR
jgi:hypothetical protein